MTYEERKDHEPVDEIEEDLRVLFHVQAFGDTDPRPGDPSEEELTQNEAALKQVEHDATAEISTSQAIAKEWTSALGPLLHGDDPEVIQAMFKQFHSWIHKQKSERPHEP